MLKPTGTMVKTPETVGLSSKPLPAPPVGDLKIEDGVPIPTSVRGNPHSVALRRALEKMKPGQSARSYISAASAYAIPKDMGIKTVRRQERDDEGRPCFRIWRVK